MLQIHTKKVGECEEAGTAGTGMDQQQQAKAGIPFRMERKQSLAE
jgi:hypothetical protein